MRAVGWPPNGLELSPPASQGEYRAELNMRLGETGTIELLGGPFAAFPDEVCVFTVESPDCTGEIR